MKVAYVIDSSAGLSHELANHPDVYTVTLKINLPDGQTFDDTTDNDTMKLFYNSLADRKILPSTSQPEPSDYVEIVEDIKKKDYDTIIGIFISSGISGTMQTAHQALTNLASDLDVRIIDSKGTSYLMEDMLIQAMKMVEAGLDIDTIGEKLKWVVDKSVIYVAIEDYETLKKGGRVNSFESFFGSNLNIYPILYFNDEGKITTFEKIRGQKRLLRRFKQIVEEALAEYPGKIKIAFAHGDAWDELKPFSDELQAEHPEITIRHGYLTPVLGSHGGKGAKGMGILVQATF
ncbi:DegV family protein [Fundicoccus culcitae]|uniref:DegV family protein n=1 Tax=Fundicoccus culcitae TaxID=2969821 RepID=A0ABY5P4R7_9LACT|nr:DegV family protein [Fundicoccus culcitae]UUX33687.1 DegV family protein [Fundicoccus culcitae]